MESTVLIPIKTFEAPLFALRTGGIECFDTNVETKKEIREIEANTATVCEGDLFVKLVEKELTVRL